MNLISSDHGWAAGGVVVVDLVGDLSQDSPNIWLLLIMWKDSFCVCKMMTLILTILLILMLTIISIWSFIIYLYEHM